MTSLRPYAQLVRLPNLPTALADILLAGLAIGFASPHVHKPGEEPRLLLARWGALLVMCLASACLYMAGMVLNDFFDVEEDKRDRPDRPIPSGQIHPRVAAWLGACLLAAGVALAFLAGWTLAEEMGGMNWLRPGLIGVLLAAAILAYDAWLKETPLGPIAMGACRFLNVLMGVSLWGGIPPVGWHLAVVVGMYVAGLTWFARTEARTSSQRMLLAAAGVMLAALLLALLLPGHARLATESVTRMRTMTRPDVVTSPVFPYLLVVLGFMLGFPIHAAIQDPSPKRVQAAVKRCLICLILLDTVLATATAGAWGLMLLVLMGPSLYLNRRAWLYAT